MIKIISDSTCDITHEEAQQYNITILPLDVYFGDDSYRDFFDLSSAQFFEMLKERPEHPTTSQVRIEDAYDSFKKEIQDGNSIIYLSLSSNASGSMQSAVNAKRMLEDEGIIGDIEIYDTTLFSFLHGNMVLEASKMASEGKSKEEILKRLNTIRDNSKAYFVPDTLKYLKKGGRIKPAVALVAEVLDIRPILTIDDGLVGSLEKVRGTKKVYPRLLEILKEKHFNPKTHKLYVMQGGSPENAETLKKLVQDEYKLSDIPIRQIGVVIGAHSGPLAAYFITLK